MSEVHAVKDLDRVRLVNHLLERTYGQQIADVWVESHLFFNEYYPTSVILICANKENNYDTQSKKR